LNLEIEKSNYESERLLTIYNKYEEYLDRKDRKEIILQIRLSLSNYYYNITSLELDILSKNIYEFSCLMANEIPNDNIVKYILNRNNKEYERLSKKERRHMKIENNVRFYKYLISKYSNIIKDTKIE